MFSFCAYENSYVFRILVLSFFICLPFQHPYAYTRRPVRLACFRNENYVDGEDANLYKTSELKVYHK